VTRSGDIEYTIYSTSYSSQTLTPSSSPSAPASSSVNAGAIAGGVVGGVAALAIAGAALFFFLRRRTRKRQHHLSYSTTEGLETISRQGDFYAGDHRMSASTMATKPRPFIAPGGSSEDDGYYSPSQRPQQLPQHDYYDEDFYAHQYMPNHPMQYPEERHVPHLVQDDSIQVPHSKDDRIE
jgi:hypothetical protein